MKWFSFTKTSLYTVMRYARCFYTIYQGMSWSDSVYEANGLEHDSAGNTSLAFWGHIVEDLVAKITEFEETEETPISVIVVSGDGGDNADFREAVAQVVQRISRKDGPEVEVDLLPDPEFAAAKGAAMWSRMLIETKSYCDTLECDPYSSSLQDEENRRRRANKREL